MQHLLCNKRAMLRLMLNIKPEDNVILSTIYGLLNLAPLESKLALNYLRWHGHVERSSKRINNCAHLEIECFKGRGRPCKTWSATLTDNLLKAWNINANNVPR